MLQYNTLEYATIKDARKQPSSNYLALYDTLRQNNQTIRTLCVASVSKKRKSMSWADDLNTINNIQLLQRKEQNTIFSQILFSIWLLFTQHRMMFGLSKGPFWRYF